MGSQVSCVQGGVLIIFLPRTMYWRLPQENRNQKITQTCTHIKPNELNKVHTSTSPTNDSHHKILPKSRRSIMATSTVFDWRTQQHCKIHGNFESDPQGNRRTGPISWENISNTETRATLHHPVAVSGRQHLPPPPQYVEAPSTSVGRCRFHGLGRGRFFRGDWWNIWGEDYVQPKDMVSVGYGHGVTPGDMVGPATADKNGRVNVKPSRFLMTIASATEKARLRGERVAALRAGRKTVSPADRNTASHPLFIRFSIFH